MKLRQIGAIAFVGCMLTAAPALAQDAAATDPAAAAPAVAVEEDDADFPWGLLGLLGLAGLLGLKRRDDDRDATRTR
jgi:hypothetical protein